VVVLVRDETELGRWPVVVDGRPDLAHVELLARLQLQARRSGACLHVRILCPVLRDLVCLAGLSEVLQVIGQPEEAEDAGVEEVVQADDPIA
jgi:hypothetical protein